MVQKNKIQPCPCGNGVYQACCQPFHLHTGLAPTAEALMRSRYSAFALGGLGDYLLQTWHPDTRPPVSAADMGAADTDWVKLDIVDSQ